jgi:hypothetical protein
MRSPTFFDVVRHGALRYYDVANDATHGVLDHVFAQLEICLIGCISATAQGSHLFVSAAFPTFTKPGKHFSEFVGFNLGVNSATPEEAINNNRVVGGGYADVVSGGGGISGNEGRSGLGLCAHMATVQLVRLPSRRRRG